MSLLFVLIIRETHLLQVICVWKCGEKLNSSMAKVVRSSGNLLRSSGYVDPDSAKHSGLQAEREQRPEIHTNS